MKIARRFERREEQECDVRPVGTLETSYARSAPDVDISSDYFTTTSVKLV